MIGLASVGSKPKGKSNQLVHGSGYDAGTMSEHRHNPGSRDGRGAIINIRITAVSFWPDT
jgi:hypothetical protein